jgi:hypothetical protein
MTMGCFKRLFELGETLTRRGSDWKRKVDTNKETYRQWVKERVQEVKLPFIVKAHIPPRSPKPIPISIEETD